jgi:YesN/AraC family two-component response regulator
LTIIYLGISSFIKNQDKYTDFVDFQLAVSPAEKSVPKEFEFKCKLEQFMQNQTQNLDPDLTWWELATKLITNTTFLSGIINTHLKRTSTILINEFSVMEFNKAIKEQENKKLTTNAIDYDCGFNSKVTFNRAVKKLTGKMPIKL